jgi:hypothetical protein
MGIFRTQSCHRGRGRSGAKDCPVRANGPVQVKFRGMPPGQEAAAAALMAKFRRSSVGSRSSAAPRTGAQWSTAIERSWSSCEPH